MKLIFTLLTLLYCSTTLSQFAVTKDNDNFTYIRQSAEKESDIIDSLRSGEIVYCFKAEGKWIPIDYAFGKPNKRGYIHKKEVRFINKLKMMPIDSRTEKSVRFKKENAQVIITTADFEPDQNGMQFHHVNTPEKNTTTLVKVNGKDIWGTDGQLPKKEYGKIQLQRCDSIVFLPKGNLFAPDLETLSVYIDKNKKIIYITAFNGVESAKYAVLWIAGNNGYNTRIVTMPY